MSDTSDSGGADASAIKDAVNTIVNNLEDSLDSPQMSHDQLDQLEHFTEDQPFAALQEQADLFVDLLVDEDILSGREEPASPAAGAVYAAGVYIGLFLPYSHLEDAAEPSEGTIRTYQKKVVSEVADMFDLMDDPMVLVRRQQDHDYLLDGSRPFQMVSKAHADNLV